MAVTDTIIRFTTSTKLTIAVKENQINNTSTSLFLYGKSTLIPSKFINTNLLYILENFCNDTIPLKPIEGQLWCNTKDADSKHETGRLQINIKDSTNSVNFHDIAGTVMNEDGNLRHLGQIEAVNEYNSIDQAHKDTYPEDVTFKRYLTTKKHCDENYLYGDYSTDNSKFYVRGDKKLKTQLAIPFTAPGTIDDDRYKLINKQYLDQKFLSGENCPDDFGIPTNKKLYYSSECLIDLPYQLITKKYCLDQDANARKILDALMNDSNDGLEKYVLEAEAAAEAARIAAEEAWAAVNSVPPQTTPATITITVTSTADTSLPTVTHYTGSTVPATVTGTLTNSADIATGATYTVKEGATDLTSHVTRTLNQWSLDTATLGWTVPSTHTLLVTRTESDGTPYSNSDTDQIVITAAAATVDTSLPTVRPYSGTDTHPTVTGTLTNLADMLPGATFTIKAETVDASSQVTLIDVTSHATRVAKEWSLDTASFGWVQPTTTLTPNKYTIVVTRTESDSSTYSNADTKQIEITPSTVTAPVTMMDVSIPTVNDYTGINTHPTIGGYLSTEDTLGTNTTYTITIDGTGPTNIVPTNKIRVVPNDGGNVSWTIDTTYLNWTADSTHSVIVTRIEDATHSYVSTSSDQIRITSLIIPTVNTKTVSSTAATCTIVGTIGTVPFATAPDTDNIKIVVNNLTYYRYNATNANDSSKLTVTGLNWTLADIPTPPVGQWDVIAMRNDNPLQVDNTVKELTVAALKDSALPTVVSQTLNSTNTTMSNVAVTGTVGSKKLADSKSTFAVVVTDSTNTPVTGTITYDTSGINWTYTMATINTGETYNVVATRTDEFNNTFVDDTTDELEIQHYLDVALPTVTPVTVSGGFTVDVVGTVGSKTLAASNSTFSVVAKNTASPFAEETGTITYNGTGWTCNFTDIPERTTYNITATRTDEYGNKYVDNTSRELVVNAAVIPPPAITMYMEPPKAGDYYTYTVPAGKTSIEVTILGGGGGGGGWDSKPTVGGYGGDGDKIIATGIPVTPGEKLRVYVGVGGAGGFTGIANASTASKGRTPPPIGTGNLPSIFNLDTILSVTPTVGPTPVKYTYLTKRGPFLADQSFWDVAKAAPPNGTTRTWEWDIDFPRGGKYIATLAGDDYCYLYMDGTWLFSDESNRNNSIQLTLTAGIHRLKAIGKNVGGGTACLALDVSEFSSGFNHGGEGAQTADANVGKGGSGGGSSAIIRETGNEILIVAAGGGGGGGADWNRNGYDATNFATSAYLSDDPTGDTTQRGNGGGGGGGYLLDGVINRGYGKGGEAAKIGPMLGGYGGGKGKSYVQTGITHTIEPAGNKGVPSSVTVVGDGGGGYVRIKALEPQS